MTVQCLEVAETSSEMTENQPPAAAFSIARESSAP
jgi:hypothetical protein